MKKTNSSTVTQVTASTSAVTLSAEDRFRAGGALYNRSNKEVYVKFGSGASTSSFSVIVPRDGYLTFPEEYFGIITGVWATGAQDFAMVTEFIL